MSQANIGLIGLAVMGQNLVLNMARNGYTVAVYNRTAERTQEFITGPAAGQAIIPAYDIAGFVSVLKKPRTIMIMVKAGAAVDAVIEQLKPFLEAGDLVIDGGNSYYADSERRAAALADINLNFLGVGVSGGEEGALWGPSMMPGGSAQAYARVEPIFRAIAAKVDSDPCVAYIGPGGSGHYVKMVHNGIEYGDMQLIAEAYALLKSGLSLSALELHQVFTRWNQGPLASYLIEITADIFTKADPDTGSPLVDVILDAAGQKGTGKWTSQDAFDRGTPIPTITAAVDARILSSLKAERQRASGVLGGPKLSDATDKAAFIAAVEQALYASKICAYAQGMGLLAAASREFGYQLKLDEIARIWRGGCIIRAAFLEDVRAAYAAEPTLPNLLLAPFFRQAVSTHQESWRHVIQTAVAQGIPVPAMGAALAYYDSYRSARLPANLIQAQRDYFGAHTYQRVDKPGTFHTEWTP